MVIRWLDESPSPVAWLGAPETCATHPGFTACYASHVSAAIAQCENEPDATRSTCIQYYTDAFAFTECRKFCPEWTAPHPTQPVTPARFPTNAARTPSGGGGYGGGKSDSGSKAGWIIAYVIIGGIAYYLLTR